MGDDIVKRFILFLATLTALAWPAAAQAAQQLDHVVVVIGENNTRQAALGNSYLAGLANQYGDVVNAQAITHPSLPNYLALSGGSTFGVTDDAGPGSHPIKGQSVFGQTNGRTLAESMPSNCQRGSDTTLYSTHHNPQVYYVDEAALCQTNDIPYAKGAAPNLSAPYTFVTPNKCDDGHNACNGVANTAAGRVGEYADFVKSFLPLAMKTTQWTSSRMAIVLTFDEGSGSDQNVYEVVISNQVTGHHSYTGSVNHYTLLGTIEGQLGVPLLRSAVNSSGLAALFSGGTSSPPPPPPGGEVTINSAVTGPHNVVIDWTLKDAGHVRITVDNSAGSQVRLLAPGTGVWRAGAHTSNWGFYNDAKHPVPNGAYTVIFTDGSEVDKVPVKVQR